MPDPPRTLYWDSSVFLSYINETAARIETLDELLERAARGEIEIVTSVCSIVEVAFVSSEQGENKLSEEAAQKIDALWSDRTAVRLIEFHELIARDARALIRGGLADGWALKPFDAIHLATASRAKVAECHTYDPKWEKYQSRTVIPRICEPYVPGGFQKRLV